MVLAVIVLFYIAAALLYLAVNRKRPLAAAGHTAWSDARMARAAAPQTPPRLFNVRQKPLLDAAQRLFYVALKQAVANGHEIFLKIRAADLLIETHASWNKSTESFKDIADEYFDFIICRHDSLAVIAAIRLSSTANHNAQTIKDKLLRAACKAEKIPFIVVKEKSQYDIAQLKKLITLF